METHTEQQLAGRLRRGDHSALSDLDQTYRRKIYQLALSYMKNHWDAEEVTQDVLFRVVRKIDTFRGDAALSSWIYRITFNTAMSRLRSARFGRPFEIPESSLATSDDEGAPRPTKEAPDRAPLADDEVYRAASLKADADGPRWTDRQIAEAFSCRAGAWPACWRRCRQSTVCRYCCATSMACRPERRAPYCT